MRALVVSFLIARVLRLSPFQLNILGCSSVVRFFVFVFALIVIADARRRMFVPRIMVFWFS